MKPGSGPRHFVFHPNGKLAFVINELASTVTSLAYRRAAWKAERAAIAFVASGRF